MYDPPILTGANIFVVIAVVLIAALAAIVVVDIYKGVVKKKSAEKK